MVGSYNQRGLAGNAALVLSEDQRFLNTCFEVVSNAVTGKAVVYATKRPGWGVDSLVAAGSASTGLCKPQSFAATLTAFGDTNSTIYFGTNSVGVITGRALHFTETLISGIGCVAIKSSDGTGWYYMDGAKDVTAYTADGNNSTTITDIKVAGVSSVSGLYVGQKLTAGANIAAGSRIASINAGAFSAVLDTITTGGAFNDLAITKEPIAKIIDSDFVATGTSISAFAALDGYLFYATDDGYVNNSDLNSVASYTANARIAAQQSPDPAVAVAIQKEIVVVFGFASNQKFQNVGISTGSPLQVAKSNVEHVGALDQRSMTNIEDDIYFVSTPYEGDLGVYLMRGLGSTRVSTSVVDRLLGTAGGGGAIYASSFRLGGYQYAAFVVSTAQDGPPSLLLLESGDSLLLETGDHMLLEDTPAQTASFVRMLTYNTALKIWSEWDCNQATFVDGISTGTSNQIVATSRMNTSGNVYTINPVSDGQLYTDDGVAFSMEIRTAKIMDGEARKSITRVTLLGWDARNTSLPYLSWSDDDYQTFSTPVQFTFMNGVPCITRLGSHCAGRAYKITHSANAPFRAEALNIEYKEAA